MAVRLPVPRISYLTVSDLISVRQAPGCPVLRRPSRRYALFWLTGGNLDPCGGGSGARARRVSHAHCDRHAHAVPLVGLEEGALLEAVDHEHGPACRPVERDHE